MAAGAADCASCGIVFAKYAALGARRAAGAGPSPAPLAVVGPTQPAADTAAPDHESLLDPPSARGIVAARAVLWAALVAWTVAFARHSVASNYAGESVLHLVNLVFHEAGHIVFAPFGQFLTAAGGSILQVLVPVVCGVALFRAADRFGATVGLWWAGQSLLDLAPYIADARALRLVLLGGRTGAEVEGHDWEYLLSALGWSRHDTTLGQAAHVLGLAVMALALAAGLWLLVAQWRRAPGRDPRCAPR